ncbi:G-protein alpha subunit [Russula ochroleuca]|uniref:G-protein alpha subunit n=1 Tax=Russula ochroleuca TaxID=152965 RepID=A0A9P5N8B5_9AGAM|nr:G-protein alpha subunit [Russula ochroleuca]KAF8463771.1 G-protein alpha subunit [Russula ochroleuca]KAF8487514.1 G-protein alpha subunit [Russula ochroleuca]
MLFMSIFSSWNRRRAEKKAKAWSDEIDMNIEQESKSFKRQRDVLLMSVSKSETAASNLIRRMKLIHNGRSNDELAEFTNKKPADFQRVIWELLLQNSRGAIVAMRSRNLGPTRSSNKANCEYIMNHRIDTDSPDFSFLPKFGRAVQDLWVEEIIPVLLEDPSCLAVDDNEAYFFAEAQRIVAEEYVPSTEDILHVTETGIMETYFKMGQLSIRVSQVYGQKCERRKWIHLFEGVTNIIFYTSLSDYDQRVVSWNERTWLAESFILFDAVVNSRWFLRTSVILLLGEIHEFSVKLHEVPLAQYCPEYTGGTDVNKSAKYILWRYMQLNRARIDLYPHIVEVSDITRMRLLWIPMREIILHNALKESGIL